MSELIPVLALDGPSGSGKGTIGQICAVEFDWHYLDNNAAISSHCFVEFANTIGMAINSCATQ